MSGCGARKNAGQADAVVATVNGQSLSRADFELELARELELGEGAPPPTPEQLEPIKRQLLNEVIEHALLLQAAKEDNVSVGPEEVDREILRMSADYPADGFDEALSNAQLTMAEFKRKTAERLTITKLFEEHVYPRVGVTEEELQAFYEEHAQEFQEPEEVHAQQIVVKDQEEARRIQAQLRAGKRFSDLARRYSLSADAKVGGDLGFFKRGDMPDEIDELAFRLAPGQTSDVVSTEYGYQLIKVLERRPARRKELAQVRGEVEKRLVKLKREQAQRDYVEGLRKKAQIQVNEPVFQAVTGQVHASPAPKAARGT